MADIAQYADRLRDIVRSYYDKEISRSDYLRQRNGLCDEIAQVFMPGESKQQSEASGVAADENE